MSNPKIYYAMYDGMEQKLITFVEKERTKKPLISGGGNLGFIKLVSLNDYEYLKKEKDAAVEQLKAENLDLKKTLNSVKNCQVGDFIVYHPTKDPDADNVFDTIAQLKSKLGKAKEALEHIQQPFNNETNYIDRAVRAQEKAWDVLREIGEG